MSKRRRLRRFLGALILLLILLAAGWTAIWYVAAGRVASRIMAWEQERRAEGWVISQGPPQRSGWPMAAGVRLPDIRVSAKAPYLNGGVVWQAGALTLAVDIRHLAHLYWGAAGRQTIAFNGGRATPFQATTFAGELALWPGARPRLFQLHATGLIAAIAGEKAPPQPLSVATIDMAATADAAAGPDAPALAVAATMTGVAIPPHRLPWLGDRLQSLSFDVALTGPAAAAPAWRNAGGSLALRSLRLSDGPLTLEGQGRFRLDAFLRPEGTIDAHLTGVDAMVGGLARQGALRPEEARAIRAMLDLMMRPGGDGLNAPLTLAGGVLGLGPIPVLRLPLP